MRCLAMPIRYFQRPLWNLMMNLGSSYLLIGIFSSSYGSVLACFTQSYILQRKRCLSLIWKFSCICQKVLNEEITRFFIIFFGIKIAWPVSSLFVPFCSFSKPVEPDRLFDCLPSSLRPLTGLPAEQGMGGKNLSPASNSDQQAKSLEAAIYKPPILIPPRILPLLHDLAQQMVHAGKQDRCLKFYWYNFEMLISFLFWFYYLAIVVVQDCMMKIKWHRYLVYLMCPTVYLYWQQRKMDSYLTWIDCMEMLSFGELNWCII